MNAVSLIYMGMIAAMLVLHKHSKGWSILLVVAALLLAAQYASALGYPPEWSYPWAGAVRRHRLSMVLFRWLDVPVPSDAPALPRAPASWGSSSVLLIDFFFVFLCSHTARLLQREPSARFAFFWQQSRLRKRALGIWLWLAPAVTVLLLLLAFVSRKDLLCYIHLFLAARFALDPFAILSSVASLRRFFRTVLALVLGIITLHVAWPLPGLLVSRWSAGALTSVQLAGLRYVVPLTDADPEAKPWSLANGLLLEVMLALIASLHLAALRDEGHSWTKGLKEHLEFSASLATVRFPLPGLAKLPRPPPLQRVRTFTVRPRAWL
jgi:hypothetical protein